MNNGNSFNHHQMQNLSNGFNHHLPVYGPSSDDSEEEGINNFVVEELPSDYPSDDLQEEVHFIVNQSSDDSEDSSVNNPGGGCDVHQHDAHDHQEEAIVVQKTDDGPQGGGRDVHQHAAHDHQEEAIVVHQTADPQEGGSNDFEIHAAHDPRDEAIDVHQTDDPQGGIEVDQHAAQDPHEEAIVDVQQTANHDPGNMNFLGAVLLAVIIVYLKICSFCCRNLVGNALLAVVIVSMLIFVMSFFLNK